jgi:uncharacterized membrane protein YphA (DoxX/SURF4 family)
MTVAIATRLFASHAADFLPRKKPRPGDAYRSDTGANRALIKGVIQMSATSIQTPRRVAGTNGNGSLAAADWRDPRFQAFALLRVAFTVAPIAFGLDKFFNVLVDWPQYLAPWINNIMPGSGQDFMYFVGAIEILAGVIVALKPRYGAYVVAGWLAGIIINLLSYSGYYDIALRDFGLMLGALTLGRLASVYDPPLAFERRLFGSLSTTRS